jgi:hypothetical protein
VTLADLGQAANRSYKENTIIIDGPALLLT